MIQEFIHLLKDPAHWAFEILLIIIFDGIIGLLLWPHIKQFIKHIKEHE